MRKTRYYLQSQSKIDIAVIQFPAQDLEVALSVFTFRLQCLPCSLEKVHEVPLFGVLLGKMAVIVPVIQAPGLPAWDPSISGPKSHSYLAHTYACTCDASW